MTVSTVFDVGSIVKPITAAAIYKLEAEGTLNTADTLDRFFEDVPEDKASITIEHVLRHLGAFPDHFGGDYELITRDELRRRLFDAPLVEPFGESRNYSNSGYSLLAMIVEDVSGMPYEEYVFEHLLRPAGNLRIGYAMPAWRRSELAVGAQHGKRFGTPLEHPWYGDGPSWHLRGNGGMLANASSLHDLFLAIEKNPEVLPELARRKWIDLYADRLDSGQQAYGVLGGNGYYNAMLIRVLDADLTIVGMSNVGDQQIEASLAFLIELLSE